MFPELMPLSFDKPSNINGSDGSHLFTLATDDGTVKDVNVVTTLTGTI